MNLQDRFKKVQDAIAAAAAKARRNARDITMIAVTKTASTDQIKQLIEMGQMDLGESRVQQMQQRAAQLWREWLNRLQAHKPPGVGTGGGQRKSICRWLPILHAWHMIRPSAYRCNKVKPVMTICKMIHSIDSLRLAEGKFTRKPNA